MGRLIIYLYRTYYYYYYSCTNIYIYCLYDVTGCFLIGFLYMPSNCTEERKCFSGYSGPTMPPQSRRNGALFVLMVLPYARIGQAENLSEGP